MECFPRPITDGSEVKPMQSQISLDTQLKITANCFSNFSLDGRQMVDCHGSGSPMYLAPETIMERPVNGAVDIWACGVILYLLLVSITTCRNHIVVEN